MRHNSLKTYIFPDDPVDVVIPCIDKDLETLELCIAGIRNNCPQIREVIVVSSERLTENAAWFDERRYPFSKYEVALSLFNGEDENAEKYLSLPNSRLGWYYQQLLKFYAPFVIPNLSSNALMLDSDTIFLNPVAFLNSSQGGLYNPGFEYHPPYFVHAAKLTNNKIKRLYKMYSGISHHMLFQRAVLEDLFKQVESFHHQEFWRAFCSCVNREELSQMGASEYEIYFNFVLSQTDQVAIRPMQWRDISDIRELPLCKELGLHYVSCHHWKRAEAKKH